MFFLNYFSIKMASKKSTQLLILPLIPQGDVKLLDESE